MFLWFSYGFPMVFQRITGTTRADLLDQSLVARSLTEARPASWDQCSKHYFDINGTFIDNIYIYVL